MPIAVIVSEPLINQPGEHVEILKRAGFEIRFPSGPIYATGQETIEAVRGADAVLAGSEIYSREVIEQLPDLRVISRCGVGYDRVDVAAATDKAIALCITPNGNHEAVAEHAMALLLALCRNIVDNTLEVRAGTWRMRPLVPLRDRTLGIVGFGRIGRSVAARAAAFRINVLAYDPIADADAARRLGAELVDLDTLLARSDFVSAHVPVIPETKGMFNRAVFSKMKRGSYFVNTARGALVNEADLLAALQSGQLAGAGLDVLAQEPPTKDHPLYALGNVIFTPHVASYDPQALKDMSDAAAQNIVDLYQGKWPDGSVVNAAIKPRFAWRK